VIDLDHVTQYSNREGRALTLYFREYSGKVEGRLCWLLSDSDGVGQSHTLSHVALYIITLR